MRTAVSLSTTTVKGHKYWQLRWYCPTTGRRLSQSAGRCDEVSRRAAEKMAERKDAELHEHPERRTGAASASLQEWTTTFVEQKKAEGAREGTLKLYHFAVRLLIEFFGADRQVHAITKADAMRFAAALRNNELDHIRQPKMVAQGGTPVSHKPMSGSTARKHLASCRAIFAAASEAYDIGNPFTVVKLGKPKARQWTKVTGETFWKLYNAAPDGWKVLLALCRLAGLRRSDAMALRWSQVKMTEGILDFVQVKTGIRCRPPICPELGTILSKLPRPMQIGGEDFVVPRMYVGNEGRDFRVICKAAGVTAYRDPLHTLRKSCIDDWAKAGYPANVVKEWAGHADIKTTLTYYATVEARDVRRAVMTPMFGQSDATLDATVKTGMQATTA